jgi:hypothetical protein
MIPYFETIYFSSSESLPYFLLHIKNKLNIKPVKSVKLIIRIYENLLFFGGYSAV